nr:uncharacterized protein LOC128780621 isoform X3 [Desmodus rotundus]
MKNVWCVLQISRWFFTFSPGNGAGPSSAALRESTPEAENTSTAPWEEQPPESPESTFSVCPSLYDLCIHLFIHSSNKRDASIDEMQLLRKAWGWIKSVMQCASSTSTSLGIPETSELGAPAAPTMGMCTGARNRCTERMAISASRSEEDCKPKGRAREWAEQRAPAQLQPGLPLFHKEQPPQCSFKRAADWTLGAFIMPEGRAEKFSCPWGISIQQSPSGLALCFSPLAFAGCHQIRQATGDEWTLA